jgi:hypothetical protein
MLTLLQARDQAMEKGDILRATVIEVFARESPILQVMPFEDIAGGAYRYNQESGLPGIAFRGVNETYTESTGVINPVVEPLMIIGGDLDVDNFTLKTQGAAARENQELLKIKRLASYWTQRFIKGDNATEPREFDGLQIRLTGTQKIINGAGGDGGVALSLASLDQLISAVKEPTHLLMTVRMLERLTQASRLATVSGTISFTQDTFGRRVTQYCGLPILPVNDVDIADAALDQVELGSTGATATATSIYAVRFGNGGVFGLQNGPIDARDLGELDTKSVKRTRVEWFSSFTVASSRAAARLYGVKDLAVVV